MDIDVQIKLSLKVKKKTTEKMEIVRYSDIHASSWIF